MDKAMKLIKYKENPNYSKEKEELKKEINRNPLIFSSCSDAR